jgi:iron complex transport system ATP-binding protein
VTHAALVAGGQIVAAGPAGEILTSEQVSACFGLPVVVERSGGRVTARAVAGSDDERPG